MISNQIIKLKSGKVFEFNVNFNENKHKGLYDHNLGIVSISYFDEILKETKNFNFTLEEAVEKLHSKEWIID